MGLDNRPQDQGIIWIQEETLSLETGIHFGTWQLNNGWVSIFGWFPIPNSTVIFYSKYDPKVVTLEIFLEQIKKQINIFYPE